MREQGYKRLIGVAQALPYLHEECDQMVVHSNVKPSNVLIDADLNARLGDFGLARTYDHGLHPQMTHIVGTLGYLAPELAKTGKASTRIDVYGYGAPMLEVTSGRRPIEPQNNPEELVLVDWARDLHSQGDILRAVDPALDDYNQYEAELVLSLGLLCSLPHPDHRPSMRSIVQIMLGNASLPELSSDLYLESAAVITDYSIICGDDSTTSCDRASSSENTSFSSFDKKLPRTKTSKSTSFLSFDKKLPGIKDKRVTLCLYKYYVHSSITEFLFNVEYFSI